MFLRGAFIIFEYFQNVVNFFKGRKSWMQIHFDFQIAILLLLTFRGPAFFP